MCYSVLRCVAVCCGVLQCVAVCCSVLRCVAVCCSVFVTVCCGVLQCIAVCCSAVQCVAVLSLLSAACNGGVDLWVVMTLVEILRQDISLLAHTHEQAQTTRRIGGIF